jgi:cytochrome c peroxidase
MKFAIKFWLLLIVAVFSIQAVFADDLRTRTLQRAALEAGLKPAKSTNIAVDPFLVDIGKTLFESKELSIARDTACSSCHLDQFGSADGLPVAIGTEASGFGNTRIVNGGDIIPRNVLPLWGRGDNGFDVLFWDGKVEKKQASLISQFGKGVPSDDPLVVAAMLPPVEIGEMFIDADETDEFQTETLESATVIYDLLIERVKDNSALGLKLASASQKEIHDLDFVDVANALAAFIRHNFRVQPTKLHRFVFQDEPLTKSEIRGGLLFYGKGRCSLCHNGPFFSDLAFHSIPIQQIGFGKNGFGVDYGRFNVTLGTKDQHLFRTPPLLNVTKTGPYGHSGGANTVSEVITAHFDPLRYFPKPETDLVVRTELYLRLGKWTQSVLPGVVLDDEEVKDIETFLKTLNYDSEFSVTSK